MDIYRSSGQIKQYNHNSWRYEPFKAVCHAACPVEHAVMRSASACWSFCYLLICLLVWQCINTLLSHGGVCAGNKLWCVCVCVHLPCVNVLQNQQINTLHINPFVSMLLSHKLILVTEFFFTKNKSTIELKIHTDINRVLIKEQGIRKSSFFL